MQDLTFNLYDINYRLRYPTKREMDIWENEYKTTSMFQTIFATGDEIQNIWKRIELGTLNNEIGERMIKIRQKMLKEWLQENFKPIDGISVWALATAKKMEMCIIEPKKSMSEWLEIDEHIFDQLSLEMNKRIDRELRTDVQFKAKLVQFLSNYPKQDIPIAELMEVIQGLEADNLKKN